MKEVWVFTDGGARGNPGQAAIGIVVQTPRGKTIHQISERIGETTNNIAEYKAVITALTYIANHPIGERYKFFLDSQLVVSQLNGLFKTKKGHLKELLLQVRLLEQEISVPIIYQLIPREENKKADDLVNLALDQFRIGTLASQPQKTSV